MLMNVILMFNELVPQEQLEMRADARKTRNAIHDIPRQVEAVNFVQYSHIEWSGRRAFFFVTAHMKVIVIRPATGQAMNQPRVSMVGKNNGLIRGEHRIKIAVREAVRMMLNQGRCYEYLRALPHKFRRGLLTAGLSEKVPGIFRNWKTAPPYFVPLRNFPPALRQEVEELLRWRQAEYVPTRRKKRLRPVSARNLENVITRLYGFVVNVRPGIDQAPIVPDPSTIRTLTDLATFDNISAFTAWWLNVRKRTGRAIVVMWGALCAALKEHPNYKGKDFTWFDDLMRGIPYEPESKRRERKERKYLPYETVADIPRRIRERRKEASKLSPAHMARMVHDELLMMWITVLPWRQRNLRECRRGLKSEGANLFKAEIAQWDTVTKPKWVQEKQKTNPHEQFWQYHFREHETKNGHEVRSVLPLRLIPLLEEYLEHHRPLLLKGTDPGTLFLNEDGLPFSDRRMGSHIAKLTLRYAGRRVTPHMFRDIFAYWWLEKHPEDYLTVSKKLWHKNIQTTLRSYATKFDESQADCRVEEWMDSENRK